MIDGELMNYIKEAAAQGKTSLHEMKCKTCSGDGFSNIALLQRCPECNGTGKENAK